MLFVVRRFAESAEHTDEESKTNKIIEQLRRSNNKLTKRLQTAQLLHYDDYRVKAIRSLKANVRILTSQVDVLKHELKLRGVGDETVLHTASRLFQTSSMVSDESLFSLCVCTVCTDSALACGSNAEDETVTHLMLQSASMFSLQN